jgi:hypothetical protein
MGSIQNGQRGRDSENQSCRNRGGHRSSQTIKHRTPRCRADRTAPANSVGIGEAAGAKNMSIKKLREMVFGRRTEKRRSARREERKEAAEAEQGEEAKTGSERSGESSSARKMIIKGHGRKPASAYSGAKVVICRHPEYQAGDRCPDPFCDGHLYQINPPNSLIQFTGRPLIEATKYRCEVLRCWDCQTRYEAPLPAGVAEEKYPQLLQNHILEIRPEISPDCHFSKNCEDVHWTRLRISLFSPRAARKTGAATMTVIHFRPRKCVSISPIGWKNTNFLTPTFLSGRENREWLHSSMTARCTAALRKIMTLLTTRSLR